MAGKSDPTRRDFIATAAIVTEGFAMAQTSGNIPKRPLGKTGVQVSALGVGGYHLGSAKDLNEARQIIDRSIDAGINFFDNCWEYHDGKSEEWMGAALKGKRQNVVLMTKVCTHGRDRKIAFQPLQDSLP